MEAHTEADALTYGNSIAGNKGHPPGEGNVYDAGRLRPKGYLLQASDIWKGRDFTCFEVYERVVKTVISVGKKTQEC